ncbi:L-ascorbate peroxidase 3 [Rhizoclosmatium sp. JEL0117]|nr:L-ascorbate peroxidase 3 [Rhizoclosmatium sp. JEL0117]
MWTPFAAPTLSDSDWARLRSNVAGLVRAGLGPKLIRLAFKDATGTPHGQSLLGEENAAEFDLVTGLKSGLVGSISNADTLSFAGAVAVGAAIQSANLVVPWRPGRADVVNASDVKYSPATGTRMRSGMPRTYARVSGYAGPWTTTPLSLTNEFFVRLALAHSNPAYYSNVSVIYNDTKKWQWADTRGRMMLPVDLSLINDASYMYYVNQYATDQTTFITDFLDAYSRLLEYNVSSGLGGYVDTSLTPSLLSTQDTTLQSVLNSTTMCYPLVGNPIICAILKPDGSGNTIFTIHSLKTGWAAFGLGESMMDGDVIIGYPNQNKTSTAFITTYSHGININYNPVWQQIDLVTDIPVPKWAKLSFSAVHVDNFSPDSGRSGKSIAGKFIFAVSSYPPANVLTGGSALASSFFQHEISGVFGDSAATDGFGIVDGTGVKSLSQAAVVAISVGALVLGVGLFVLSIWVWRRRMTAPQQALREQPQIQNSKPVTEYFVRGSAETLIIDNEIEVLRDTTHFKVSSSPLPSSVHTSYKSHIQTPATTRPVTLSSAGTNTLHASALVEQPRQRPQDHFQEKGESLFQAMNNTIAASITAEKNPQNRASTYDEIQSNIKQLLEQGGSSVFPADPISWTSTQVALWLVEIGVSALDITRIVFDEKINGRVLLVTRVSDLCSVLGITRFGERALFEEGVGALKRRCKEFEESGNSARQGDEPPLYLG